MLYSNELCFWMLDTLDYASYPAIIKWVEDIVADDGLNVLINNAAIAQRESRQLPVSRDAIMLELETNAVAPLMLTQVIMFYIRKQFFHVI